MITSKYNRLQVCIDILCLLVIINCVSELNNIAQPTKRKNVRASIKVALIRDPKGGGTRPELQNDREKIRELTSIHRLQKSRLPTVMMEASRDYRRKALRM